MITPQLIEKKLVDFYLKTTGHYGNSIMQSIDVTEETLIEALEGIDQPIKTFENIIKVQDARAFNRFLASEETYWGAASRFRYIVFLCYIAAQDGFESENFRAKLQKKLGLSSPPRLDGVNKLFRQLVEFTLKSEQYRKVEIPCSTPQHMKLIGIIYEFSFPNWRLKSLLNKNLYKGEHTPETLRKELLINLNEFKQHEGLYQAIRIFTQRVALKNKFLEEDPFWNFYLKWNKPKGHIEEKIYFNLDNDLKSSYFDLPYTRLKVCDLHGGNTEFFSLKRKNKSFENRIFFLKRFNWQYELIENIHRIEDVDAILYHLKTYDTEEINKNEAIFTEEYCFLEVDYRNIEQIKKIFLNYKDKKYLPPLQILSSYRRKELLSLNMAPIKFRANFDGEIELIHSELKHSKEIVYEGDEIYLPHLSEGELKLILTTRGEFYLSKVEKFHIVNSLKDANIKSEKNELNLYTITKTSIFNVSENIKFNYQKTRSPNKNIFEELIELIYFNSLHGISESSLLKLISTHESLSKFSPYNIICKLKHYGYIVCGYHNNYKSIKYWPKQIFLNKFEKDCFFIQGYISKSTQNILCDQLDCLGVDYIIKRIEIGEETFPVKVLVTNEDLGSLLPEYFLSTDLGSANNFHQISFLSEGERYYKSFDIFKFNTELNKFFYIKDYLGDDGIYMLKQKDKKKCNVYEIIHRKKSILSTYCRDETFDWAYKYGMFNLALSEKDQYISYSNNFSCSLVLEYFSKNGVLPYLDLEDGHYYYPKGLVKSSESSQNRQELPIILGYNLHRHRKNIRFRA